MFGSNIPLGIKHLPLPPKFHKLLGPSFILLGLGLGSGEVILWPYLSSNYGLGIIWGALLGITMQFFINMEVERYALINGESVFVGFTRLFKTLPFWFILSTFLGFGWPGIGLAGANLLAAAFGLTNTHLVAVAAFVLIGLILSLGNILYQTVEKIQIVLIIISIPLLVSLAIILVRSADYLALFKGLAGIGHDFMFMPAGIAIGTFLGALAYSGAGGNLNLAQSFYVRDKGYGMGFHADRITSVFTRGFGNKDIHLSGNTFPVNEANLRIFKKWWRLINWEHFIVFWMLGLFTMVTLSLLAFSTTYGLADNHTGINFVLNEARVVGLKTLPVVGSLMLVILGVVLTATQMTVLDSTSRIITENVLLSARKYKANISLTYYIVLWLQIFFGITIIALGFDQPLQLITLGAIINAFSMFAYSILLLILNNTRLKKHLRPSLFRNLAMGLIIAFYGFFCGLVLLNL